MSEKEKKALKTIFSKLPEMSEFQQGRLYGMAEMLEEQNRMEGERKDGQQFSGVPR